jgi:hypothetical protein
LLGFDVIAKVSELHKVFLLFLSLPALLIFELHHSLLFIDLILKLNLPFNQRVYQDIFAPAFLASIKILLVMMMQVMRDTQSRLYRGDIDTPRGLQGGLLSLPIGCGLRICGIWDGTFCCLFPAALISRLLI